MSQPYETREIEHKATENPYFKCGFCDTELSIADEVLFQDAVKSHGCNRNVNTPWYSYVFSFRSALIVFIICITLIQIFK